MTISARLPLAQVAGLKNTYRYYFTTENHQANMPPAYAI